ncbi:MAG: SpoIIE family protein phosphatase [Tepidisphaeraceae bacterium]
MRILVVAIVVLPIVAVSLALAIISTQTSRRIAEELGGTLVRGATARVDAEVRNYLGSAVRTSDVFARRVENGQLPATGGPEAMRPWHRAMLDDLVTRPSVASICFGNPAGDTVWLLRNRGHLEYGWSDGSKAGEAKEFRADPSGLLDPSPLRVYQYDPRQRPWYKVALDGNAPTWTPVYFWFGEGGTDAETGAGYTRVVRDGAGDLLGVVVIDVTLGALSDFLQQLPLAKSGYVFLVDEDGLLVAGSEGPVTSANGRRTPIAQSQSPAARAAAPVLDTGGTAAGHHVDVAGEAARVHVTPLSASVGMNWRVVTVIPEKSFLAGAWSVQRWSALTGLVAVAAALALGWLLSRRLSNPFVQLSGHVSRVGGGDFDARIHLDGAREFTTLSNDINRMAAGLRQRMELEQSLALATQIQQSLLPRGTPRVRGLDIAGQSRYCDSTGGDYYDFIDVAGLGEGRALVAVGDVMGHGIGAALLMATARAALRAGASSPDHPSLADLMARVNHVLTHDARHGLFMTMALLIIDAGTSTVRWASAGHDPTMLFDLRTDQFLDLEGGDIPLGVSDGVEYSEFTRTGLRTGSILVVGTDGIWEARNEADEMYGKERLRELVRQNAQGTAEEISRALDKALVRFIGNAPVRDDVTFVIVKMTDSPPRPAPRRVEVE